MVFEDLDRRVEPFDLNPTEILVLEQVSQNTPGCGTDYD
jgi:hypothetical protein